MRSAVMWSTGTLGEKKPCSWPAWRSMVRTRSAPEASSMRATPRALIGSPAGGLFCLGADRLAAGGLLVLAAVAEPRRDGDDAVRGGADGRVDHEHQLHDRVVGVDAHGGVAAGGLEEEDVGAADRLVVAVVDLAVGEGLQRDGAELDAELVGDLGGELG